MTLQTLSENNLSENYLSKTNLSKNNLSESNLFEKSIRTLEIVKFKPKTSNLFWIDSYLFSSDKTFSAN